MAGQLAQRKKTQAESKKKCILKFVWNASKFKENTATSVIKRILKDKNWVDDCWKIKTEL